LAKRGIRKGGANFLCAVASKLSPINELVLSFLSLSIRNGTHRHSHKLCLGNSLEELSYLVDFYGMLDSKVRSLPILWTEITIECRRVYLLSSKNLLSNLTMQLHISDEYQRNELPTHRYFQYSQNT
jgi:hypothetical protein